MKKRKGKYSLLEAINLLEATTSNGYPDDGTGVAGDDDRPPGNIVYGEKYKKADYFNRLTTFQKIWKADTSDWSWDEFENSMGMEDFENYSNTIQGMKDLFPKEVWRRIWAKMKNVPDDLTTLRFKQAGQPHRKGGRDQTGDDDHHHIEIDAKKDGAAFKDADVTNKTIKESNLTCKIDTLIV
jgi:hypothetical protein